MEQFIPQIKICGLVSTKDAIYLNRYGVDYAGMVLYFPKSKRCITIDKAKEIMDALQPSIKKVAVTVSPTLEQVQEIEAAGFDILQVHGKLQQDVLNKTKLPIFRAFNIKDTSVVGLYNIYPQITGYVFDGEIPGGGKTFDWSLLDTLRDPKSRPKKLILAGGLHADNVLDGIHCLNPDIVDVSSGVEIQNGIGKDEEKIKAFVHAVRCGKIRETAG